LYNYIITRTPQRKVYNHTHTDMLLILFIQSLKPKTYPSQKTFCIFTLKKAQFSLIYKLFFSWGQENEIFA